MDESDYEMSPDTPFGRGVFFQGKRIGDIKLVSDNNSLEDARFIALLQKSTFLQTLGGFSCIREAFHALKNAHKTARP